MSEKRVIDWEGIEREYRAGVRSIREIASEFSVSHVAIGKRAERDGWSRDLGAKIRARADALVTKEAVTSQVTAVTKLTEKAIVEANATLQATIRHEHRTDIQRVKRVTNKLLEKLESLKVTQDTLKEQTSVLKQLADTQKVVVAMEREAFGIAQMVESTEGDEPRRPADHMEDARRVAFILSRASALIPSKAPHG